MKQNRNFFATALVALLAAGAYAACPISPNLAGAAAVTAFKTDEDVPRNLIAQRKSDEGVSQNLIARLKSDEGVPQNRVSVPRTDEGVPNNRVAAARSAERSFEHREPPPKHLVAVRSCKDLELKRLVAG